MKIVMRPYNIISLGGYIVEVDFPYRNIIVVNPTAEPIKMEVPVFDESWIEEHRELGLIITPVTYDDNYLGLFRQEKAGLDKIKAKLE
jgi:energy-converting hydrogenase B subunit P